MISDPTILQPAASSPAPLCAAQRGDGRGEVSAFDIPLADLSYFSSLPATVQDEVRKRLYIMAFIFTSKKINPACKFVAANLRPFGGELSWSRIRALFYSYRDGNGKYAARDWRILVNWAKAGGTASLPPKFVEFWRTLCERHQRATTNAHRELLQIWRTRFDAQLHEVKEIPGYPAWPVSEPETDLPAGWTPGNLARYTPDKFELAAARIGIQKASALGFKIRTSRVGLRLGEFMEFDDHEFNVKVNFPGQLRSMRPRCFGAVDALTDCMFSMVIKPTFWDIEAQAKKVLGEKDFMWFIVAVLTHRGYRPDIGTMLLVEWGTATVRGNKKLRIDNPLRDDFEKRIYDATLGKVRVDRGGRFHTKANPGQFAPPSGGNFRFKPHVEQYWRMLDDWLDALKGQTGKGRDFAPEEMERTDAYNAKLLKAAQTLGVDEASRLILPRMTFEEFTGAANQVMNLINDDRDHKCNSWEKCGFLTKEFRRELTADAWQPYQLIGEEPADIQALVAQNDLHYRVRRMARSEADRRHASELTRLPFESIPALVGPEYAGAPVTVRGGKFLFQDWRIGPDPLEFVALDAAGHPLREGERFVPYCNPMSPDVLVICDARHAVVSVCPPVLMPSRNDEAGVKAAMGFKNNWIATKLAPQRARHAASGAEVDFMKAHNAQVLPKNLSTTVRPETFEPAPADCSADLLEREAALENSNNDDWQ
jgi:hypothetical protein